MGRLTDVSAAIAGVTLLALVLAGGRSEIGDEARQVRRLAGRRDLALVARRGEDPSVVDLFAPVPAVVTDRPPLEALLPFRRVHVAGADRTIATLLAARFGRLDRHGAIRSLSPAPAVFDAARSLEQAIVTRGGEACPRRAAAHHCPGPRWRTVEARDVTIGGHPISCLFAHPGTDGLRIAYPASPRLHTLRGAAGLSDRAARRADGPAVQLSIEVGGQPIAHRTIPNRPGLVGFSAPVPRPGELTIDVGVSSQGARSFCFVLWGS